MTEKEKAKAAHDIWAHWMKYMFTKTKKRALSSSDGGDIVLIIPNELAERWKRQMNTPFEELTEQEKKSDHEIGAKYLK